MEKKYCIVCGCENFSRSKLYCSLKCKNQAYYQENKERLLPNHKEWIKNNSEKNKEASRKWQKKNHEHFLEDHKQLRTKKKE